jgi:hypothetical protein
MMKNYIVIPKEIHFGNKTVVLNTKDRILWLYVKLTSIFDEAYDTYKRNEKWNTKIALWYISIEIRKFERYPLKGLTKRIQRYCESLTKAIDRNDDLTTHRLFTKMEKVLKVLLLKKIIKIIRGNYREWKKF